MYSPDNRNKKSQNKKTKVSLAVKLLWTVVLGGIAFCIVVFACAYFGVFGKLPSLAGTGKSTGKPGIRNLC